MIAGPLLAATLGLWMFIFDYYDKHKDIIRQSWWKYLIGG